MIEYLLAIWKYLVISAPFLLIGLVAAGFIHTFINVDRMKALLGKGNFSGVFKAALLGIPLPICSCGVIPAAVTLRKNGASNGATSSFLIATPESGVDSIAMTYAMMDFPMTLLRPLAAFCSAFLAGILQIFFNEFEYRDDGESSGGCCKKKTAELAGRTFVKKMMDSLKFSFKDLISDMSLWLAFGIVLGATIEFFIPANIFENMNWLILLIPYKIILVRLLGLLFLFQYLNLLMIL